MFPPDMVMDQNPCDFSAGLTEPAFVPQAQRQTSLVRRAAPNRADGYFRYIL